MFQVFHIPLRRLLGEMKNKGMINFHEFYDALSRFVIVIHPRQLAQFGSWKNISISENMMKISQVGFVWLIWTRTERKWKKIAL